MDAKAPRRAWTERLLDQVLPAELDWEDKVISYPVAALLVAAGMGFVLGRQHGSRLSAIVASVAADRVASTIADVLDNDS